MKKIILPIILMFLIGCKDKELDAPPTNCDDINIKVTHSIKQLKNLLGTSDTLKITDDIIIAGYVTSSDLWGNQYKELVIQDSTAGIDILVDKTNLYLNFPVGSYVYVKCKDLYLGKQYTVTKLGSIYLDGALKKFGRISGEDSIFNKHFVRTCSSNVVEPKLITIDKLHDSLLYTLIKIDSVQFTPADTNSTWADGINFAYGEHYLIDKYNRTLLVRTSGYASFAKDSLPKGSGSIVGILGKYNTTYQLYIRNLDDVKLINPRF